MKLIQDLEIKPGTRVLLRCDLNLPQDQSGNFTDFFRLESSLPTIEYLQDLEATVFIVAHLGSPKGSVDPALSLAQLAPILQDQLGQKIQFVEDPFDQNIDLKSKKGILLIENLRFWPGEESASIEFAGGLISSTGSEVFIQDAFGVVHREHASLVCFPKLLPSAAGLLLQKEIQYLSKPSADNLALIVGGAKVESKLPVISNFIDQADVVLTGGVVANTFLKSNGQDIASSLFDENCLKLAEQIFIEAESSSTKIILPSDYLTATSSDALLAQEASSDNLQPGQLILDLGNQTVHEYQQKLNSSKTIIWAGTLGFAENPVFAESSKQILKYLLELKKSNSDLKIIIGGGDTVDFTRDILSPKELGNITHLSTGGGASLLMLSGQPLPGIEALNNIQSPDETQNSRPKLAPKQIDQSEATTSKLASGSPILIANLKSHFNLEEAKSWASQVLQSEVLTSPGISLLIAPPNVFLQEISEIISQLKISNHPKVIAQDISEFKEGSETGQVAASQLASIASGTIIGHSERRNNLKETNETIAKKLQMAVSSSLKVILCVGGKSEDDLAQRREVHEQLTSAISGLNSIQGELLSVAYEPVFAIGSGKIPSDEFLVNQLSSIKGTLHDNGIDSKILYGGSVNAANAKSILSLGFSGLLVGTASLKPESLESIGINITA